MNVKIKGEYKGHGVSKPTEIINLFRPVKFCGDPKPKYSLAAWTDYLDDVMIDSKTQSIGSLVLIALESDAPNFSKEKPFIYVHHRFTKREIEIVKKAEVGDQFKLPCGCTYDVISLEEYPVDVTFDIIITGHNVDER